MSGRRFCWRLTVGVAFALIGCRNDSTTTPGAGGTGAATTGGTTPASGTGAVATTGGDGAGGSPAAGALPETGGGGAGGSPIVAPMLRGAPFPFSPTASSFGLNAVVVQGDPTTLVARTRELGSSEWSALAPPSVPAANVAEWTLGGLSPSTLYEYEILAGEGGESLFVGSTRTQRLEGESFSFALLADSHIGQDLTYSNQGDPEVLRAVSRDILAIDPDFMVNLGDMLDFHQFGFNEPPRTTWQAYLNYRELLGPTLGQVPHFGVIGNWEGENGDFAADDIEWSQRQRLVYLPNPDPGTYPEGGAETEDYYAFTWGDALFIVLNVMTYTPTSHLLQYDPGLPDDWTLGEDQFAWFQRTLENATSKWRFVLIHHAVGGAGPGGIDAAYGRGGGQAAYVGEQALVHQLMREHGAQIFFYGHDHVFTDMVVDDIHYTLPGSAGAIWMFTAEETGYNPEQTWAEPGFGRVDVGPDAVDVQFIGLGGELLYSYRIE